MRIEPKDEVTSAFTAQEVAYIVERSQAEGVLKDDLGLLAGPRRQQDDRRVRQRLVAANLALGAGMVLCSDDATRTIGALATIAVAVVVNVVNALLAFATDAALSSIAQRSSGSSAR